MYRDFYVAHIILAILFIISVIAFVVVLILTIKGIIWDEPTPILPGTFLAIFLVSAITTALFAHEGRQSYERDPVMLRSLRYSLEYEGHFVLGTGSIKGKDYYVYYYEVEPGKYKLDKKLADRSLICEDDSREPQLVVRKAEWEKEEYYFYVPVGTITVDYTL